MVLSLIEGLPRDILRIILVGLSLKDITRFCRCSKFLYKDLKDPELWKRKIVEDYGSKTLDQIKKYEKLTDSQYFPLNYQILALLMKVGSGIIILVGYWPRDNKGSQNGKFYQQKKIVNI